MRTNFFIKILMIAFSAFMLFSCGGSGSSGAGGDPDVDYTPDTYTVRFKLNGGVVGELGNTSDVVVAGVTPDALLGTLSKKPTPYNLDFTKTFVAWNTKSDASGDYWTDEHPVTSDIILYAIYAEEVAQDLSAIECNNPDVKYSISSDVSVASPICAGADEAFMGRFYGEGVTVTVTGTSTGDDYAGLFGKIKNAYIGGITVVAGSNVKGNVAAGAIAGEADNSEIENVTVKGTVIANADDAAVGGIAGILKNGSVVSGSISKTSITFSGNNIAAGGIAGSMESSSSVADSYHSGAISVSGATTGQVIGGIVGLVKSGEINNCYTDTAVSSASGDTSSVVGGIAGSVESGKLKSVAALGLLISGNTAGRIAGDLAAGSTVTNSYAKSDMLVNYEVVADSTKNGTGKSISSIRKSQSFFKNTLGMDFALTWKMPRHYEYPVQQWVDADAFTEISTAAELKALKSKDVTGNYILVANIDMSGETWTPITSFSGVFDGNGKTISNLSMTTASANSGFINTLTGKVKDVTFASPVITPAKTTSSWAGTNAGQTSLGVVAISQSAISSVIEDVVVTNLTMFGGYPGGIASTASGIISNCSVSGDIGSDLAQGSFQAKVGGIVSTLNSGAFVMFSSFTGTLGFERPSDAGSYYGSPGVGGIAYLAQGNIVDSYANATINVKGAGASGGLVSTATGAQIVNSYANGSITVATDNQMSTTTQALAVTAGGLIGIINDNTTVKGSAALNGSITVNFSGTNTTNTILNIGKLYGQLNAASYSIADSYVNSGMTLTNDAATLNEVADPATTTTVPPSSGFYSGSLGWNMTDIWQLSGSSGYPKLFWQ